MDDPSNTEMAKARSTFGRYLKIATLAFGGFVVLAIVTSVLEAIIDPEGAAVRREEQLKKQEIERLNALAQETEAQERADYERASGQHCLSGWDGSNRSTVRQVKAIIRNPGSFEHIETEIYGNDRGEHGLWMTFRAENGFGGMNVERIYARVNHESCESRLLPGGPGSG